MIVSAQALATYLGQDYDAWDQLQRDRAAAHIRTAGAEVRGALAALYEIPAYNRDSSGAITAPLVSGSPALDPEPTALGPIVKMLASAYLLDPARGFQPQEDRSAAAEYRISGRAQLTTLATVKNGALVAPLTALAGYGITATDALTATARVTSAKPAPALRQPGEGLFGSLHDPTGADWPSTVNES